MTYEEIVKAYENLSSGYGAGVVGDLNTATLELLKEQKAEIERLKGEKNDWKQRYDSESNRYADLCNARSECVQKKNDRITELQKQVDELKFDKEILQNIIKRNEEYQLADFAKEEYGVEVE